MYKYLGVKNMNLYYSSVTDNIENKLKTFIKNSNIKSKNDINLKEFVVKNYPKYSDEYIRNIINTILSEVKSERVAVTEASVENQIDVTDN